MKVCMNCHLQYDDAASVCAKCGAPLQQIPMQFRQQMPIIADPTDHTAEYDPKDISDNKVFAMLPYLMSFIGIVIALLAAPSSPYTMFHVRQGLKLEVVSILLGIIAIIPIIGWLVFGVGGIVIFVVKIICFFRVCSGEAKEPPIISGLGFLK